jgi:hypothetical protein
MCPLRAKRLWAASQVAGCRRAGTGTALHASAAVDG